MRLGMSARGRCLKHSEHSGAMISCQTSFWSLGVITAQVGKFSLRSGLNGGGITTSACFRVLASQGMPVWARRCGEVAIDVGLDAAESAIEVQIDPIAASDASPTPRRLTGQDSESWFSFLSWSPSTRPMRPTSTNQNFGLIRRRVGRSAQRIPGLLRRTNDLHQPRTNQHAA